MDTNSFTILPGQVRDIIVLPEADVTVYVFNLVHDSFVANEDELQFYGDDNGDPLVFETKGWNPGQLGNIAAALRWYANFIQQPEMIIQLKPPATKLRLVK